MLQMRLRTTVVGVFAMAVVVLMRRQLDSFPDPGILNIINIATLFILVLIIVSIIKVWLPRR